MPYLIDGHNLIPYIPGLSLQDVDDENKLIEVLKAFAGKHRTRIEVFFDQAPPSRAGSQTFGRVRAHFVRGDSTADQAIVKQLTRLGNAAKNWTVVTSDREILAEARSAHSKSLSSAEFAAELNKIESAAPAGLDKKADPDTSGEVDYWMDRFGNKE